VRLASLAAVLGALALSLALAAPGSAATIPTYVSTIGGGGHAEIYPGGVDVDPAGNVYIADTGNDQVKAYWPNGAVKWTQGVRGPKQLGNFDNPRDIAYLNSRLYVADLGYNRVQVLDADTGAPIEAWPEPGQPALPSPIGISAGVGANGNPVILVALDTKNQISEYTTSGTLIRTFGTSQGGTGNGQLSAPRDAATDSEGNVYVADYGNDRIAKFSPTGTWITNWGRSGGLDGQFRRPYGVALDMNDRVYVADSTNHRVQVFDSAGTYESQYGTAGVQPLLGGQYSMLRRVAVQPGVPNPDVYLADLWGDKVDRVSQDGLGDYTFDQTFGGITPPDGLFNEPSGVIVDPTHIYVADAVNQRMQRFDTATGAFQLDWGSRGWGGDLLGFNWPRDLTLNPVSNTLWVADTKNGRLVEFDQDGNATGRTFGALGSQIGQFNRIYAVVSYGSSVIVADSANNRVQRWDMSTPTPTMVWNATGIGNPQALAGDGTTVLVTDTRNNRLMRLDADTGAQIGDFLGVGNLHSPEGLAVDGNENIWVSDRAFNRLVELAPDGTFIQAYGKRGAAHGQFNHPTHLAILGDLLYVCDVWNDRIEVYDLAPGPQGSITDTFIGHVDAAGTVGQKFTFTVNDVAAPIHASVSWPAGTADLNLFLIAPGSTTAVAQSTSKTDDPEAVQYQPTVTGTYTVRVKAASGAADFTLTVTHD
jgi:DNA-binding beta-propeller fold protein YncE